VQYLALEQLRPRRRAAAAARRHLELRVLDSDPLLPRVDAVRVLQPHLRVVDRSVDNRRWRRPGQRLFDDERRRSGLVVVVFQSVNGNALSLGNRLRCRIYAICFLVSALAFSSHSYTV